MASNATNTGTESASAQLSNALANWPGRARLSDEDVEGFYKVGHDHAKRGAHEKALSFFIISSLYRPEDARYLMALGICYKALKQHERAMHAFALVLTLDPERVEVGLHAAECLLALGRRETGKALLDTLIECLSADELRIDHAPLKARSEALLELLNRHDSVTH